MDFYGVQNYRADSIQNYKLTEQSVHNKFCGEKINYNLISIIILNLGKKLTTYKLSNLVHLIFYGLENVSGKGSNTTNITFNVRHEREFE